MKVGRRGFCGLLGLVGSLGGLGVAKALSAKNGVMQCSCGSHEFYGGAIQTFRADKPLNVLDVSGITCARCGEHYVIPGALPDDWRKTLKAAPVGTTRANNLIDKAVDEVR